MSAPVTVVLPSGTAIRGRGRRERAERVDFALRLTRKAVLDAASSERRVDWPDFGVPRDDADAIDAIREAVRRARAGESVEIVCDGGTGRTGTALAAAAILEGMSPRDALAWVRDAYRRKAVETRGQERWLDRVVPLR